MGQVISIINMKGGVGKTTLSIGLADLLSEDKSILLIDADPQFNATQAMLDRYKSEEFDEESEENFYTKEILPKSKTIYRLFQPQTSVSISYKIPGTEDLIVNLKKNLDILCGDLNLVLVNKISDHSFVRRIKDFIDINELRTKYDFIIIDCPPTLTIYTDSALMASDYYLIPNRIDRYSIVGIDSLQQAVKNLILQERLNLRCLGVIYTMVTDSAKQDRIKVSFESKTAVHDLDIFSANTKIVKNIQYGKAGPIPTQYKSSKEDIQAICCELLSRLSKDDK